MIDLKIQKIILNKLVEIQNRKNRLIGQIKYNTYQLSTKATNADKLTIVSPINLSKIKLTILELIELDFYDHLYTKINIRSDKYTQIVSWLEKFDYLVVGNKLKNIIYICWLGSDKWMKLHSKLDQSKIINSEIERLSNEDIDWVGDYKNWINPKLTQDKNKNEIIINKFINKMP